MKKLYISLQTPSVELTVKSEPDCSGQRETISIVFNRTSEEEAIELQEKVLNLSQRKFTTEAIVASMKQSYALGLESYILSDEREFKMSEYEAYLRSSHTVVSSDADMLTESKKALKDLRDLIKSQIIALKNVKLTFGDTESDKQEKLQIADTRNVSPREGFWENSSDCLAMLIDSFLASTPWAAPISVAFSKVLSNAELRQETEVKN